MSGTGRVVTPSPTSSSYSRGTSLGLSAQGYTPRRSVSSTRTIMSLASSGSSSAVQLSPSRDLLSSAANDMDDDDTLQEPTASTNFAEMLVQDLETSKSVFTSKSMTAGCPSAGLQQPSDQDEPHHDHHHHQDETNGNIDFSDSESDASLGMDPPPSIRTRGQSVTTAATSVSGRRSSSLSQKPHTPSSQTSSRSSPPSPTMMRINHHEGSWFDEDGDSDAEAEPEFSPSHKVPEVQVSCNNYLLFSHRSGGYAGRNYDIEESYSNFHGSCRIATSFSNPSGYGRSYSPSSQLTMEKPRIVNIPPVAIPKRRSSLNKGHGRTLSNTSATSLRELGTTPSMQLLATSSGRTVIDVSRPSSRNLKLAAGRRQISSPPPPDEPLYANEEQTRYEEIHETREIQSEHIIASPRRSIANVEGWSDPAVERLAKPQPLTISQPITAGISGVPLPPDVIETLRVSITCFPETMLLSSSLSVETIRTYSKKLKHRGRIHVADSDFPDDASSVFSSTTSEFPKKSPKRWNLPWFNHGHGQRDTKKNQHREKQSPSPSSPTTRKVQLDTPLEAKWAPIKAVFPYGSDYLCDALYAHVLAYNYISTLCPPPPRPELLLRHASGSSMNDSVAGRGRIPKKAASVLGMQALANAPAADTTSPRSTTPNPYLQHRRSISRRLFMRDQQPNDERASLRSRGSLNGDGTVFGMNSKNNNINNYVEAQPGIRDIHAGLEKCIVLLVATLKKTEGNGGADDETTSILIRDQQRENESGDMGVDAMLIRALCELVRMGEV
ncbi:hypothetical protein QBC43DRAFT_211295 [Cladorrhinum sp. PSN259]|nr:hypothetical protein QBC43DRAFT_211295 [Cladorrhinum sp. PSN259]